jgi:hypothetical protein
MLPDHRLLAITVLLPVSSDALESPPPTEVSMKPDNGKGRWRDDVMMSTQDIHPALTWRVAWRGNVGQIHPRPWNRLECSPTFAGFEPWKIVGVRAGKGVANFGLHLPNRANVAQRT